MSATSPLSKLALILDCSRNITQELQSNTAVADPSDSVSYLTADEFLSVFNYVLIQASESFLCSPEEPVFLFICASDVNTLATQLSYIRHFSSRNALFGESGLVAGHFSWRTKFFSESNQFRYFFTTLEAATSWLKDLTDETLAAFKKQ